MDLLEKLIITFGVSGNEEDVRDIIKEELKDCVDEIFVDKMGNLIAHKKGKAPKVMLAAHMDEIGLVIKKISEDGRIHVSAIGGIDAITVLGERIHLETPKGIIHGVLTTDVISDGQLTEKLPTIDDVFVDTGLTKEELTKIGVDAGTYLPFERQIFSLGNENIMCGKSFDDRIGCYILVELAKRLKKKSVADIYYVFTIQEEVGLFGSITSAYKIEPEWAIVVEVTNADDIGAEEPIKILGNGPCITIKDSDMIGDKKINEWIKKNAKEHKIPYQIDVTDIGSTDAVSISISKGGVPSAVIAIPIRNIHTMNSVANRKDIENTIKLLEILMKDAPNLKR